MRLSTFQLISFLIPSANSLCRPRNDGLGVRVDADDAGVSKHNPDLVFLASDVGLTSYALVANGTFQDSAVEERHWGPSTFANYRNCLWSCNWYPLRHAKHNEIAAEKYGLPQALSNGRGDNCGPNRMPPQELDAALKPFFKNVDANRQRLRYLTP